MVKCLPTLFLSLTLALAAPPDAAAQKKAVPLTIIGDTVLVVKSVPFKVVAPEGATDYTWTLPPGVEGEQDEHVLTVTKAPQGTFLVRVKMVTIDFERKKVIKDAGAVEVVHRAGPNPPPPPPDELTKRLQDAYAKDTATADKASKLRLLADVYANSARMSLDMTGAELFKALRTAVGLVKIGDDDLRPVREVIQAELKRVMPADTSTKLSTEEQLLAKALFERLASSLLKVAVMEKLR